MADKPETSRHEVQQQAGTSDMAPGDEAPPGTPGTGADVCPTCSGSGRMDGEACGTCAGRGRIIKAISAGP